MRSKKELGLSIEVLQEAVKVIEKRSKNVGPAVIGVSRQMRKGYVQLLKEKDYVVQKGAVEQVGRD
jgi:hypothetical protein